MNTNSSNTSFIMRRFLIFSVGLLSPFFSRATSLLPNFKNSISIEIQSIKRIFFNQDHNAFPDAIYYKNNFFVALRSCPDGHMVFTTSRIIILSSRDGINWSLNHSFSIPNRDVRDPHFCIFKNNLFLYTGTWYAQNLIAPGAYEMNMQLGFSIQTSNGKAWSTPKALPGTEGHYIWKAGVFNNKMFLSARRNINFKPMHGETPYIESVLLSSDDGFNWSEFMLLDRKFGDEIAFMINKNGLFLGIARGYGLETASLLTVDLLTKKLISNVKLQKYIGGPMIHKWGEDIIVGGREHLANDSYTTSLYLLKQDKLIKLVELPSGGDCSYPGMIVLSDNKAMVVYYSSHGTLPHENKSSIYIANLYKH